VIARPDSNELHDLKNDPDVSRDISRHDPDKVQELFALIDD
jgi:hypothetical protein